MKWNDFILVAIGSILKNKMRSLLTILGIIIGVAAVIVMVAIGQGAQARVEDQIAGLGTNLIIVFPGSVRQGGVSMGGGSNTRLTLDDVDKLKANTTLLAGVSPIIRAAGQVIGGIGNWNTVTMGVSADYPDIRQWNVSSGDFFTINDVKTNAKVCLIGQTIAQNLFPDQDPIGQEIRVREVPFKIIGLMAQKGQNAMGQDQDDIILAPYTTVQNRLSGFKNIQQILCSAVSPDAMNEAQQEITSTLREAHRIQPGEDDDFTVRNQTDIASTAQETTRVLTILLASIASVSMIVGGIGIMNIMLVSVTERTREIGIRRAIGARGNDILTQFLFEAVVLSLAGGILGVLFGFIATRIVSFFSGWATVISPFTVFMSFGFAGLVGIFFGFYPARKASGLVIIDALRYD
ncbi:MAG: FtsX-like permease family protein [Ignavibacteria bacterium]|jgi:putative ABC transport system permease protein|nr:FtsX-like permease family protein [Ignavibacteria bacterium]MCU7504368.1 FtsX-like permease family protein [Ignavibacteria bacterium]MCU7517591.1 FtsX-like permease family protein [Ignavibacteria bacterium]